MTLRQIIYISRSATRDEEEVRRIGRVSAERNQQRGVTGLLLYDGSRFIQAIEGDSDAIQSTMDRIFADKRHSHIQIAADRLVEHRHFESWHMQTRQTPAGTCSEAFLAQVKDLLQGVGDTGLQALFIGFAVMGTSSRA